jgi:hypothetical protein
VTWAKLGTQKDSIPAAIKLLKNIGMRWFIANVKTLINGK